MDEMSTAHRITLANRLFHTMQRGRTGAAALAMLMGAAATQAADVKLLSPALGFNVFVADNLVTAHHIEGGTAVGKDLYIVSSDAEFNSKQTSVPLPSLSIAGTAWSTSLLVNGTFRTSYTGKTQIGTQTLDASKFAATSAKVQGGRVYIYNAGSYLSVNNQSIFSSTSSTGSKLEISNSSAIPKPGITTSAIGGTERPINFTSTFATLRSTSTWLSGLATTAGSSFLQSSGDSTMYTLTLVAGKTNVINVSETIFANAGKVSLNTALGTSAAGTTAIVFNVIDTNRDGQISFGQFNAFNDVEATSPYVVYNFGSAATVLTGEKTVVGSMLAPNSTIVHAGGGKVIAGQIIAENLYHPSSGEIHYYASAIALASVPEPATYAACLGVLTLAFVWWRRRATRN